MTRPGTTAYLQTMFGAARIERSGGIGAALVRHVHRELDARGIDVTLLHHAQHNPLSAPFWHRYGIRPLRATWEAGPPRCANRDNSGAILVREPAGMLSTT